MPDKPVVLVIGDNDRDSTLYRHLATELGLIFAANADEAIEQTSDNEPVDLVLLNAGGLGGRGVEICLWLKTDHELKQLPILAMEAGDDQVGRWFSAGASDFLDRNANPALVLARIKRQLELEHKTGLLRDIASLDTLTALPDRRRLNEYLDIEWRRSLREYYPLSMIKLDIDDFGLFNTEYGIGNGDDALKRIARALETGVNRAADMLSRYGGDEFVVLLPSVELDNALIVAEKMVEATRDLAIANRSTEAGVLTLSAGVATIEPSRDKRYQDLHDEVEEMLARARQMGGDQAQGISV